MVIVNCSIVAKLKYIIRSINSNNNNVKKAKEF